MNSSNAPKVNTINTVITTVIRYLMNYSWAFFLGCWIGYTQEDLLSTENIVLIIGLHLLVEIKEFKQYIKD